MLPAPLARRGRRARRGWQRDGLELPPSVGTTSSATRTLFVLGTVHTPSVRQQAEVATLIRNARPDVVLVELDRGNAGKDERVRQQLRKAGLERAQGIPKLWTDEVWVHPSVRHLVAPYVAKPSWTGLARQLNYTEWLSKY